MTRTRGPHIEREGTFRPASTGIAKNDVLGGQGNSAATVSHVAPEHQQEPPEEGVTVPFWPVLVLDSVPALAESGTEMLGCETALATGGIEQAGRTSERSSPASGRPSRRGDREAGVVASGAAAGRGLRRTTDEMVPRTNPWEVLENQAGRSSATASSSTRARFKASSVATR